MAIFFHYLHAAIGSHQDADAARALLRRSVEGLTMPGPSFCLFRGAPGVAWALAHLRARGVIDFGEREIRAVDAALLAGIHAAPPRGGFDLARGLVGLGVYALERLPAPVGADALEAIVERLDRTADRTAEGAAWFRPPDTLFPWQREQFPLGLHDLGVAHGAAGVIALLARTVAAGVAAESAGRLMRDAVRWLRGCELPAESASRYPAQVSPGEPPRASRLAWCYGDPGVGLALLAAARATEDAELEAHARSVLRAAALRAREGSGVLDAPFCHGAAGATHLFHRAWRATGDEALREAALRWLRAALEMRRPDGFPLRVPHRGREIWSARTGVLEGTAGVGLALLAAVLPVAPAWDRIFLIDVQENPCQAAAAA